MALVSIMISMIEPNYTITESYRVVVSRTLVDTSNWYAKVLVINWGCDVVVLSRFSCVGSVVQVSTGGQLAWASSPTY